MTMVHRRLSKNEIFPYFGEKEKEMNFYSIENATKTAMGGIRINQPKNATMGWICLG